MFPQVYIELKQVAKGAVAGVDCYLFMLLKCPQSLLGLSDDLHSQHPSADFDGKLFWGSLHRLKSQVELITDTGTADWRALSLLHDTHCQLEIPL